MNEQKQLNNLEIASFCRQASMFIKAGLSMTEGLSILINDTLDEGGKKILNIIYEECNKGNKLHEALETTGVFPEYVCKLIALGEESGDRDTVLDSLADYYDREEDISDSVRSAFTYPLIMIGMMVLIIVILIAKVLPIFNQVFKQLGTEMSGIAVKLMNVGTALSKYAMVIIVVMAVIIVVCTIVSRVPAIRKRFRGFLTKFPITREFYKNISIGRFASGMAIAMSSGMDTYQSLDMVSELVENEDIEKRVDGIRKDLEEGMTLAEAIAKADIFSNLNNKMIDVAANSGNVDTVLEQIAERYEVSTARQLNRMLSIIEPTLVIIMSVVVGVVLLSVLLPLMGIMSSIG